MAEYRRRTGLQVQNIGTGDLEARGILSATQKLSQFAARREEEITKSRAEKAQQEGLIEGQRAAQSGEAPAERKANPIISAVFGKPVTTEAYERGVKTSYYAATQADARLKMDELRTQHKGDSQGFQAAAQQYTKNLLEAAPDDLRPQISGFLTSELRAHESLVRRQEIEQSKVNAKADATVGLQSNMNALSNAIRAGDENLATEILAERKAMLSDWVESGLMTEAEQTLELFNTEQATVTETIKGTVMRAYDTAPKGQELETALAALDELEEVDPELLSADDRKAIRAETIAELNQLEAIRKVEKTAEARGMLADYNRLLIEKLKGGDILDDIEKFNVKWGSTPEGQKSYAQLLKAAKDERDELSQMALVQKALTGGFPLSQDNKTHRDAADAYFRGTVVPNLPQDGTAADVIADFVKRSGIVPASLQSTIVNTISNPETVEQGIMLLEGLQRSAPASIAQIPEKHIRKAELIRSLTQSGLPMEQAAQTAHDLANIDAGKLKARREAFAELFEDSPPNLKETLDTVGEGFFVDQVDEIPPGLNSDFRNIAENEYARTGDMDTAQKLAARYVKSRWAVVERNGERVFKENPPELHYGNPSLPPEANTEWIMDQVATETSIPVEQIQLVPSPRKLAPDGRPVYQIIRVDENGVRDAMPGSSFIPEYESSPMYQKLQKQAEKQERKAMEDARRKREILEGLGGTMQRAKGIPAL